MSAVTVEAFKNELQHYSLSKGTIRFQEDDPLPDDLIRRLVDARVAEEEAKIGDHGACRGNSSAKMNGPVSLTPRTPTIPTDRTTR